VLVDRGRNGFVRAEGYVLVNHRGPGAVVAHPRHKVAQRGSTVSGELVAGVP
jgi:uncharacterized protein (AIM24 family)